MKDANWKEIDTKNKWWILSLSGSHDH